MHKIKHTIPLIRFAPLDEMSDQVSAFLEETFEVVSINYTDDGKEEYLCYCSPTFDIKSFEENTKNLSFKLPPYSIEYLEDKNWLTENVIKFSPFEVGNFLIYGIHETTAPKTDKIPIQIYAATAFGSEHPTTKMCLSSISELKTLITPQKILDMGTGSGILSIAALKQWQTPTIIAADIDPESVDVTNSNTITNSCQTNIQSIESNGYQNPLIAQNAPYDLIFANILLNPLKEMAPSSYSSLKHGGYYLISGFIQNQLNEVLSHHQALGFKLIKIYDNANWHAVLLQK